MTGARMILQSEFRLRPGETEEAFSEAWNRFAAYLRAEGLASEVTPLCARRSESGFDTAAARPQKLMTSIRFPSRAAADRAWAMIEAKAEPMNTFHAAVLSRTADAVFTFWEMPEEGGAEASGPSPISKETKG